MFVSTMTCHSCQLFWKVVRLPLSVATSVRRFTTSWFNMLLRRRISTDPGERPSLVWPPRPCPPRPWADPPRALLSALSSVISLQMKKTSSIWRRNSNLLKKLHLLVFILMLRNLMTVIILFMHFLMMTHRVHGQRGWWNNGWWWQFRKWGWAWR